MMSLPLDQCVGRWRLHVPPVGAVLVRYWGLYAHNQGEERAWCREQVGQGLMAGPEGVARPHEGTGWAAVPLEGCPVCRQPLVCRALLPHVGVPPPAETGWEQVA
jgi:hypothetical protein